MNPLNKTMQISQTFPARGLERQTICALEDKVIITYANLFREFSWEYDYDALAPKVIRGRTGDSEWSNIGWYTVGFTVIALFVFGLIFPNQRFLDSPFRFVILTLLVLAVVAFCMRFVKQDQVWFYEKDDSFAFGINLYTHDRDQRERIARFVIDKIKQADASKADALRANA